MILKKNNENLRRIKYKLLAMQLEIEKQLLSESKIETIIGSQRSTFDYLKDCYLYKDLFFFLSLRDVQVRYKQTFFGISWALLRPLLNMVLFAIVFGKLASLPSHDVNYYLYALAGILPWQLFVNYISENSSSLVNNANLITKLYFPRCLIPLAGLFVNLVDFAIGIIFLTIMMVIGGYGTFWSFILIAPFIILLLALSIGLTLWLSALTVKYRDFRFVIPLFFQIGMFISPVAYDSDLISQDWSHLYALNPLVGIINGFRFAFFGIVSKEFFYSVSVAAILSFSTLLGGFYYFKKMENNFADQI